MLYSGKNFWTAALLALALVFVSQRAAEAATTVHTDNVSKTNAGAESASGTRRLTSSFTTGADATFLQSVTLLLANTASGQATVSVYTNGLISPGTLVGTLASPASFTSGASETTFKASGIPLAANTTYWVVLQANGGTFTWGFTRDNTGDGTGYTHTWGESDDAGASWQTYNVYPLQMRVTASSTDTAAGAPGVVQLSAASYTVGEGGGSVARHVDAHGRHVSGRDRRLRDLRRDRLGPRGLQRRVGHHQLRRGRGGEELQRLRHGRRLRRRRRGFQRRAQRRDERDARRADFGHRDRHGQRHERGLD